MTKREFSRENPCQEGIAKKDAIEILLRGRRSIPLEPCLSSDFSWQAQHLVTVLGDSRSA